jgi:hypothetical protein
MRTEPLELAITSETAVRRYATRPRRLQLRPHQRVAAQLGVDVIDAAFAWLQQHASRLTRIDAAIDKHGRLGSDVGRPLSEAVVSQLAVQLEALDRQRDQLAQLLRDINAPPLAD